MSACMMRKVDNLGRITLPMALRRIMDISPSDSLEIFLDEDRIVLCKSNRCCVLCSSAYALTQYRGKYICAGCLQAL